MSSLFVSYVPIPYHKRVGKTKVHLLRDSLRTVQCIVEGITIYNPLKIFILFSGLVATCSVICILAAWLSRVPILSLAGIAGIFISLQIFCMGLIAVLLRCLFSKE